MRCLLCALALLCVTAQAALVTPLALWQSEGGRLGIRLYHGNDDRALTTRLAFAAPQNSIMTISNSSSYAPVVLPHPMLAVRADPTTLASINDYPVARMARTRIASRAVAQIVSVEAVDDTMTLIPDWTLASRWQAALFLDAHSDIWQYYACWTLDGFTHAFPTLTLEISAECAARDANANIAWNVQPYTYSLPRDSTMRKHTRRAGTLLLGLARLTDPVLSAETRAQALGCRAPRCRANDLSAHWRADLAYPVVFDLESSRNYLPASLHFLCNNASLGITRLRFMLMDSTLRESVQLACAQSYALNGDSDEIVLGLPFLTGNFSRLTYDARAQRVFAVWALPPVTDAVRYTVSVLILMLNTLFLLWLDARVNYATMAAVLGALDAPVGPAVLSFPPPHATLELVSMGVSALNSAFAMPYIDAQFSVYALVLLVLWLLHVAIMLGILGATASVLFAGLRRWGTVLVPTQAGRLASTALVVPLPGPLVIARYTVHLVVLTAAMLLGLLVSAYSVFMLMVTVFVAVLTIYFLAYYVSVGIICAGGLRDRARLAFSDSAWGAFLVFETFVTLALAASTHLLLVDVILQGLNSFYPTYLIDALSALIIMTALAVGVYKACNDVFVTIAVTIVASK